MNQLPRRPAALPFLQVAIATRDGVAVTEHFGSAARFDIWRLDGPAPRLIETRRNVAACGHPDAPGDAMDASVALVADCRAVVVTRIGECALGRLGQFGILAFEGDDPVADVITELAAHFAPRQVPA